MDVTPVVGLDELDRHLDELVADSSLPLNAKLFDDVELQLTESNIPPLISRLLPKLTTILKQYTQDPTHLANLSLKLLGPVPFTQVLALASEASLAQALDSPSPAANLLAMSVLHKAAARPADAAILAAMTAVLPAFLLRWLAAPQVEVGQKGGRVLGDLLDVDCELPPPPSPAPLHSQSGSSSSALIVLRKTPGTGQLWRRVFREGATRALIVDLCTGRHAATAGDPHQQSLAQGRLLRLLPRLAALNFAAVSSSTFFNPAPALTNGNGHAPSLSADNDSVGTGGLLHFAALRMVDRSDRLMRLNLTDFFEALVSLMRVAVASNPAASPPATVEALRALLREAMADDDELRDALLTLPDRTLPEEADDLRRWLREVMPAEAVRVAGRWA